MKIDINDYIFKPLKSKNSSEFFLIIEKEGKWTGLATTSLPPFVGPRKEIFLTPSNIKSRIYKKELEPWPENDFPSIIKREAIYMVFLWSK